MYGLACPIREGRNGMKGMPVVVWVWVLCAMFQSDGEEQPENTAGEIRGSFELTWTFEHAN